MADIDLRQFESDDEVEELSPQQREKLDAAVKNMATRVRKSIGGKGRKKQKKPKAASQSDSKQAAGPAQASRVIYLGHLPHGFFETQMRGFFSQFGEVTRLRLSRNPKSGKSRHYAFVEFADAETAAIVAEAMNGYMLFHKTLVCDIVPVDKQHESMFARSKRRRIPTQKLHRAKHNRKRTDEEETKRLRKVARKQRLLQKKLALLGIKYKLPNDVAVHVEAEEEVQEREQEALEQAVSQQTPKKASPAERAGPTPSGSAKKSKKKRNKKKKKTPKNQ
ncbi:MAG: hypothetical protein MHM6MM_002367 [Cercozoa sp. M6MM]